MTRMATMLAENRGDDYAWSEQTTAGLVHWLRAGGQLGEWADNTLADIQFASQALQLTIDDTVLNLSCGWGRHAIALANHELNVIGLDASASLLELARETGEQMNVSVQWVHGDLDDLALAEQLNAVVQFRGNLLEWAKSPADALHMLDRVHAILRPGGRCLFGTPDWELAPPLHRQSRAETAESTQIYHRYFDPDSRTVRSQTIVFGQDGSQREFWRHTWHPTLEQVASLLYQAGFHVEGQLNGFNFSPYDPNRPGLVWLVQRG